jgi:hypothetical protein
MLPRTLTDYALILVLLAGLLCAMAGCSALADKSVAMAGTVSAVKIETSGSASTGTPTPTILMGGAAYAFADSPADANQPVYVRAARTSFFSQLLGMGLDDSATIYIGTKGESAAETSARLRALTDTARAP